MFPDTIEISHGCKMGTYMDVSLIDTELRVATSPHTLQMLGEVEIDPVWNQDHYWSCFENELVRGYLILYEDNVYIEVNFKNQGFVLYFGDESINKILPCWK